MGFVRDLTDRLLNVAPGWIYAIVVLVVFAEDAFFLGFVLPGETVAVLGGVAASQGQVSFPVMLVLVIVAASCCSRDRCPAAPRADRPPLG